MFYLGTGKARVSTHDLSEGNGVRLLKHPTVQSSRQHIRLWFEFYKLALANPAFTDNLAKVGQFYEPWGDPMGVDFDDWWKDHKHLFGATRVEEISKAQKAPNVLNIAIPLNQPISQILSDVKTLLEKKQGDRLRELGMPIPTGKRGKPKLELKLGFGPYEINAKELRGRPLHEAHVVYRIWLEMGKPTINSAFLQATREALLNRPKAKWLPSFLLREAETDRRGNLRFAEEQIRQMRRSIKKAQDVCLSVSKGTFP